MTFWDLSHCTVIVFFFLEYLYELPLFHRLSGEVSSLFHPQLILKTEVHLRSSAQ